VFYTWEGSLLAVWKYLWNLPKITHLACCNANYGLWFGETKRGKTTHIRRWFRDLLEHFPTSDVKIWGTVSKLCQIHHFWTFFVVRSLKHKIIEFKKKELFVGMSWTQCNLNVQNRSRNFGDIIEKRRKRRKKIEFLRKIRPCSQGARLHFIAKRLDRPSFFVKRGHLSNIRVKSEGVVATAWWVGVEWPIWVLRIRCLYPGLSELSSASQLVAKHFVGKIEIPITDKNH